MTYNPNIPYNYLPDLPPVFDRDTSEVILSIRDYTVQAENYFRCWYIRLPLTDLWRM